MIKKVNYKKTEQDNEYLNYICEECREKDESVLQNLILRGFKVCNSCNISKTLFPL